MPDLDIINDTPVAELIDENDKCQASDVTTDNAEDTTNEWLDVLGSGDIKIKTLVEGLSGTRPQNSEICTVRFTAELENGQQIEQQDELIIELGGSDVVQGLDLIFSLLDEGQKVNAIVKSRFAYGKLGQPPNIPPDSTILYTIEMLKVEPAIDLANINYDERKKKALKKKEKGNWWFARGDAQKSIQCYRSAIDTLQESTSYVDSDEKAIDMPEEVFRDFVQNKLVIYNNLAAAQIMIAAYDSALVSVDKVIQLEPNNVKALYRKGKIFAAQGNIDEAVEMYKKAISLEPDNAAVKKELAAGLKRQALEKKQATNLYKRMLQGSPKRDQPEVNADQPPRSDSSTIKKLLGAAAFASLAVGLAVGMSSIKFKAVTSFWE